MAQIDAKNRRIEVKVVYWGPPRGGKTTTLRSLHGSCDQQARGQLASVDTEDERTYYFDYAPLDLPRRRDLAVRVHAYTVPGQEAYVETRRRILRGANAVVFVADASPGGTEASVSSWRQLDDALRRIEAGESVTPVIVAANKQDVPGATSPDEMLTLLRAAVPGRLVLWRHGTSALEGRGVARCFREALVAAVDRGLPPNAPANDAEDRRRFLEAIPSRLGGGEDGVPVADAPPRRTVHVPMSSYDPDAGGLEAALEAHRWLAARDMDVRELRRESALSRLLVDLAQMCLAATDTEPLVRSVLATLVMSLDAVTGWAGVPDAEGQERVLDAMGLSGDEGTIAETARLLHVGCADGRAVVVGEGTSGSLPGGAAGGRGLFLPFAVGSGRRGWLLIIGPPGRGLPSDAEAALSTAGAFLGLAAAKLAATRALRSAGPGLESRVAERTRELLAEKVALEERLAMRTREAEDARRAAAAIAAAEPRPSPDGEASGVVVHAIRVAREALAEVGSALVAASRDGGRLEPTEAADLAADVQNAVRGLDRATGRAAPASAPRRGGVRTPLGPAIQAAIVAYREQSLGLPAPRLIERGSVFVGVTHAECQGWVRRLLDLVAGGRGVDMKLETDEGAGGPRLLLIASEPIAGAASAAIAEVAKEVERAGGRLAAGSPGRRGQVVVSFPEAAEAPASVGARE